MTLPRATLRQKAARLSLTLQLPCRKWYLSIHQNTTGNNYGMLRPRRKPWRCGELKTLDHDGVGNMSRWKAGHDRCQLRIVWRANPCHAVPAWLRRPTVETGATALETRGDVVEGCGVRVDQRVQET